MLTNTILSIKEPQVSYEEICLAVDDFLNEINKEDKFYDFNQFKGLFENIFHGKHNNDSWLFVKYRSDWVDNFLIKKYNYKLISNLQINISNKFSIDYDNHKINLLRQFSTLESPKLSTRSRIEFTHKKIKLIDKFLFSDLDSKSFCEEIYELFSKASILLKTNEEYNDKYHFDFKEDINDHPKLIVLIKKFIMENIK